MPASCHFRSESWLEKRTIEGLKFLNPEEETNVFGTPNFQGAPCGWAPVAHP